MCGIVAIHDPSGPDPELGARMLARVRHRGPDGQGEVTTGRTWLGHTRLSIVDLEGGRQPLGDDSGERWVIVNGEIYNHAELRDALDGRFRTESDSEVVRHVLREHGPDGVARLRGMFALVAADADGGVLVARDPLGIKPLYWAHDGERVVIASELYAFEPELRAVVAEFPPGHYWTPQGGLVRYVDLHAPWPELTDVNEARAAIRDTLVLGVRRRMMADVGVGVFLSGGLDSSIVAAIMAREGGATVHSFAAGTAGSSDLAAARVVADHLGTEHHERVYDDTDVVAVLPDVVRAMEAYEPSLVRSAVPNYLLAELAADHVKVVLTGEGADELFAGYDHLREIDDADELRAELVRSVAGLHNLNLQRCDRVTMAHGLEARVPFLDVDMVELAQRVPIAWKLPGAQGQEKRILREAFAGWLPEKILWRRKEQFGDGSGTAEVMARQAATLVPDEDWESVRLPGLPVARSREELAYQRIFAEHLGGVRADAVLGRFATA